MCVQRGARSILGCIPTQSVGTINKKPQPTRGRGFEYCAVAVLLDGFDHIFNDLLRITKDHHGLVQVEQFVIQTGIPAGHRALDRKSVV